MQKERRLILQCQAGRPSAQRAIYERYAPFLLGVIRRYVSNIEDAEDVMIDAMFKVLTKIDSFDFKGSFEGWIRRIGVNQALMHLRKMKQERLIVSLDEYAIPLVDESIQIEDALEAPGAFIKILDELPGGYRTVFNLYVMDGYKHREIAEMLDISIHTSKSQLIMAKKKLKAIMESNDFKQKKTINPNKRNKYHEK